MVPTSNFDHRFDDVLILIASLNLIKNLSPKHEVSYKTRERERERERERQRTR